MGIFLSPGVKVQERDLSVNVANTTAIVAAFIGTAKKGPLNDPQFVTNPEQFIDTFGEPFSDSNLGYAVLAYLEEGNRAYVMRVGVEAEDGQSDSLAAIAIDTSGAKEEGWGRIAVFTGIDSGKIQLRAPTSTAPFTFHAASLVGSVEYTDVDVSSTDGATDATLNVTATGYTGATDETFTIIMTGAPDAGSVIDGATYDVVRNSDGETISTGTATDAGDTGTSDSIAIGSGVEATGISVTITVTGASPLEEGDTFIFTVQPDNRNFAFAVEGEAYPTVYTMPSTSYSDIDSFVAAFNGLSGISGEDFSAVNINDELWVKTDTVGERIQLVGSFGSTEPDTEGFALEVGVSKWVYDIPRAHLIGANTGPYNINSGNNTPDFTVITEDETVEISTTLAVNSATSVDTLAAALNAAGTSGGQTYFEAVALQITDDTAVPAVITSSTYELSQIRLEAGYSNLKSLKFAQELEIPYPYQGDYTTFDDSRVVLPTESSVTPGTPASCDGGVTAQCQTDSDYYASIVGYFVAASAGTWIDDYTVTLENFNNEAGRFSVFVYDSSLNLVTREDDLSFDSTDARYIGYVLNEGFAVGGIDGNEYIRWLDRPSTVGTGEVRVPGTFGRTAFTGAADGIPAEAADSVYLDAAIIGNPAINTGLYAFSNAELYDITLLAIPGVSSGSVIGQAIQLCQTRGDVIFLVDPPFGLKPDEVVDWHNGILASTDLANSLDSSYAALYHSWLKIFDQFNAEEIFVAPSGYVAGVFAKSEREGEFWSAPAGLGRGKLFTVRDLEYSPSEGERDLMYGFNNAVNPIAKFLNDGIVVMGQRTLQRADTALDRINVRLLLIYLKKVLAPVLRRFLFEPNDRFLRQQVRNTLNPILNEVAGRRGITAFQVVCDERNNTPARIDRNELHVAVQVRPTRVAEFIQLNLVVLRTEQSFTAEEVLAASGII